jgi:NDP-sugar pyrophosphorylase family protein
MQSIILAAGKGSRLHPITVNRSKAMLPILGQPIVARVMETLVKNGLRDFILVVSPDDREIVSYFERESELDVQTQFVVQPERRGMADALSRAASLVKEDFLLTACDNLVSGVDIAQMLALWKSTPGINGILALMEVTREKIQSVGIVELEGEWIRHIIEKPDPDQVSGNTASMPLYVFSRRILGYLPEVPLSPRGEYELQDAIQLLIDRDGRVRGYHAAGRLTLTSPADLLALNRHYLVNGNANHHDFPHSAGKGTELIPPLHIESGVVIGAGCVIGPNVYIERDCRIGDRATLRESVLLRGAVVPAGVQVDGKVVS